MTALIVILLVVMLGLLVFLVVDRRRSSSRSAEPPTSVELYREPEGQPAGGANEVALIAEDLPDGRVALRALGAVEPFVWLEPVPPALLDPAGMPLRSGSPVPATFLAGLGSVGGAVGPMWKLTQQSTGFIARFNPAVEAALRMGSAELLNTDGRTIAIARDVVTKKRLEAAHLVGKAGPAVAAPELLAAAAVVVVILVELEQIKRALREISGRLDVLAERLRDDDYGMLSAAEELATRLAPVVATGELPSQYVLELAAARIEVDAIYFSRRRFVGRFLDRVESAQEAQEAKEGTADAWAPGARKSFGDRATFEAEVLLYSHALITRARLALLSAACLATEGFAPEGLASFESVSNELRDSFHRLLRHTAALRDHEPSLMWIPLSDRRKFHDTTTALANLLQHEVEPYIPSRPGPAELTTQFRAIEAWEASDEV